MKIIRRSPTNTNGNIKLNMIPTIQFAKSYYLFYHDSWILFKIYINIVDFRKIQKIKLTEKLT